jgi:hypothetical protein
VLAVGINNATTLLVNGLLFRQSPLKTNPAAAAEQGQSFLTECLNLGEPRRGTQRARRKAVPTADLSSQLAEFPDRPNPNLVVVDQNEPSLIRLLEKEGLDVIPLRLRHSKMLGGGPHCVTLDVRRAGTLERYFD